MSRRHPRLLLIVAALIALAYSLAGRDEAHGRWSVIQRSELSLTVEVEGTLRAERARPFGPPGVPGTWQFKITYLAPEGTTVAAGVPLARFDDSELQKRLLEINALLETSDKELEKKTTSITARRRDDELRATEAEAALEKARLKLEGPPNLVAANERAKLRLDLELGERKLEYLAERRRALDEADDAELTALRENRDRAAARVRELQTAIARMTVVAPHEGTVIYPSQRSGEKKRVGDSVWHHEKVIEFPDMSALVAEGVVNEVDVGRVMPGQSVELRLDAHPDVRYQGKIVSVGQSVQPRGRRSPVSVVPVVIALAETDQARMRPEMRFHGRIEVEHVADVLVAPAGSVEERGGTMVVLREGLTGVEPVPVTLGRSTEELVEIRDGLTEGDRVLVLAGGE